MVYIFKPKFFSTMKSYTLNQFYKDLTSGVIVAIIALPLSIALAISSGVTPEKGLHTAIIAGFIISFLGGSKVQIGGPTGAFMIIVLGVITKFGLQGLIVSTIMAGILMVLMGVLRLGKIIKFIPYTITTGFTSGIALVIFTTQIKDFLGITAGKVPDEFIGKWTYYISNLPAVNWTSVIIGVASLLIIIFWPKINKVVPGSLVAIIVITLLAQIMHLNVETIGSRYGQLSSAFPKPTLPKLDFEQIKMLFQPALTIALLGGIESLLSAVVADGMIGDKHSSNTELIAQGIANIASGIFGGIPATGAIARTAANVKSGGRTPVAGMVHALVVLLIMIVFMPYASLIPLSTLAAVLMVVAYNMSHWRAFRDLLYSPKSDIFVLVATFSLTVLIDLVVAIEAGIVIASILFMKRMSDVTNVLHVPQGEQENEDEIIYSNLKDSLIYEIHGPLFFGVTDKFMNMLQETEDAGKDIVINMSKVPAMDATAVHALEGLYRKCSKNETRLIVIGVQKQPYEVMKKSNLLSKIGDENILEVIGEEIERTA